MKKSQSHFLISATASNSGKTSVTLGLLRAINNRGKVVQAFKCGPDYLDAKLHEMASKRAAINLDSFMASKEHLVSLYQKYGQDTDVCITEGIMGLYDGYDRMQGSTDEIAELIKTPVILVVDAKSKGYSIAPIIYGFLNYRKTINIIGVIFNFVSTEAHYKVLKTACEDVGILSLGYLPEEASLSRPENHLVGEGNTFDLYIDRLASWVEQHIDIDSLLRITEGTYVYPDIQPQPEFEQTFSVAVAYDKAFNLFYQENINRFNEKSTVSYFSPLTDSELPDADFVYIPSGYPEYYIKELSANKSMLDSIRKYIEGGGFLLAECAGLLYLSDGMTDQNGVRYPMVGIFNQEATIQNKALVVGYRMINFGSIQFRGHEFHYTSLLTEDESAITDSLVTDALGKPVDTKLFRYKNAMASYTHIYWAECGLIRLFAILLEQDRMYAS